MAKRIVRRMSLVAVAVALAATGIWALRPPAIKVETAVVIRGDLDATVTADGKTRVKNLFTIAAPVDGELERIVLKAGDPVDPSTVVARIWPAASRPLDARSRAEALAAVATARATVERAAAAEKESNVALAHAESLFETTQKLATQQAVASKDLEHAGHELDIRRQAVHESQAALEVARAELVRAEAAAGTPSNTTGRTLTPVRSPTPGRIIRVLHESAGPVVAGTPLVAVADTTTIEIAADFLTTDAMSVRPGAVAIVRDWGGSEPLAARVRHVEPGAFTKVSALGLEEQRVPIVLDLVNQPPTTLGNDFHVSVAIVVWSGRNVPTIPSTALFRVGESWAAFVVRDGRARLTNVTVGRSDGTRSVIERGLDAGDRVIVQPSDTVRDGSRVTALVAATH